MSLFVRSGAAVALHPLARFGLLGEGGRIGLISWKHSECAIALLLEKPSQHIATALLLLRTLSVTQIMDIFRSLEAVRDKERSSVCVRFGT